MCWQERLRRTLKRMREAGNIPRVAIVGVGNGLRGDDAVGLQVSDRLATQFWGHSNVCVLSAGSAPESCTGVLRRYAPDLVLFIDAAHFGVEPGSINWIDLEAWKQGKGGVGLSSHNYPLYLLADYLAVEISCEVMFLGIQPLEISFDHKLSSQVYSAACQVTQDIQMLFSETGIVA